MGRAWLTRSLKNIITHVEGNIWRKGECVGGITNIPLVQNLQMQGMLPRQSMVQKSFHSSANGWKSCFSGQQKLQARFIHINNNITKANGSLRQETNPARAGILKTFLFCSGLSASCFAVAALREESMLRKEWHRWRDRIISEQPQQSAWISACPEMIQRLYRHFWLEASEAQRAVGMIIGLNGIVFLALNSRIPRLARFMDRNFLHNLPPLPNRLITLLTANFAHKSLGHFAFNMLALSSFGAVAANDLGVNQFLSFYLTAGLTSAMCSDFGRLRSLRGGRSLGASGAVYACFAFAAMTKPDVEVVLIFLPMLPFNIADGLSAMIALDLAGAILGWRYLDHFGHLGGAFFGLYYALYGYKQIWPRAQALADRAMERFDSKL